jgi:hypothetical protein
MPDTARFRADFTFCVVKTGLAGWGGRILTFAFQNRSSPRLSHVLARDAIHLSMSTTIPIAESRYSPPGMTIALKDLRLALAEAEHLAVPMPAASLVHDRLVATIARGWTELDWSVGNQWRQSRCPYDRDQ